MSTFFLVALLGLAAPVAAQHPSAPQGTADGGTDQQEGKKKDKKKKDGDEKTEEELRGTPSLGKQVDFHH